jgi:hypothetical protein
MQAFMDFYEHAAALRGALNPAPGADQAQILLTRSTTMGMNIAIWAWTGISDVMVTTTIQHGGLRFCHTLTTSCGGPTATPTAIFWG